MEVIGLLAMLGVVVWAVSRSFRDTVEAVRPSYRGGSGSPDYLSDEDYAYNRLRGEHQKAIDRFQPVLLRLWYQAEQEEGWHWKQRHFPQWFYDPITVDQQRKLDEFGVEVTEGELNKGMASDIIGLFIPLDEFDLDDCKEAGLSPPNQTMGRYMYREWEARDAGLKPIYGDILDDLMPQVERRS